MFAYSFLSSVITVSMAVGLKLDTGSTWKGRVNLRVIFHDLVILTWIL